MFGQIQRKPYRRFDLDLGIARTAQQFFEVGSFIWIEECDGDVYIKLNDNQAAFFKLIDGSFYKVSEYKQFWIKNTAQAGKSLKALIGDADFFRYVRNRPAGGAGDMLKSTYDTGDNGVVDNSEKLEGSTKVQVQDHTPKAHTLASHSTKAHTELTGVSADQHPNTKVRTKVVDESAIADGKGLAYNATSGLLEYITLGGGGGGAYEKIFDTTLTETTDTLAITGLDLDADKQYILDMIFEGAAGGSVNMDFNSDTNGNNYWIEWLRANGAVMSSERERRRSLGWGFGANNEALFRFSIMRPFETGTILVWGGVIQNEGATIQIVFIGRNWITSANLTRIDISGSVANAMGAGTRIIMYKVA